LYVDILLHVRGHQTRSRFRPRTPVIFSAELGSIRCFGTISRTILSNPVNASANHLSLSRGDNGAVLDCHHQSAGGDREPRLSRDQCHVSAPNGAFVNDVTFMEMASPDWIASMQ
jgi:hypothetical protein